MQRREFLNLSAPTVLAAAATSLLTARVASADDDTAAHHDHSAAGADETAKPLHSFDALVAPFQGCTAAVSVCIAHCQRLLATGNKSMGRCLRTALDCDVVCNATLKAAGLSSDFTPALAKVSVDAMNACVEACKPHIEHHAECKACYDACKTAIAAANKLA